MMSEKSTIDKRKYGRKVQNIRRMLGVTQEDLAEKLGYSQSKYSRMEINDEIDDNLLDQIANLLKVPVELIKNFEAENLAKHFINNGENGNKESEGLVSSGIVENKNNNITINDPKDFSKIYKDIIEEKNRIIKDKDITIAQRDKLIEDLQKQIETLKK